MPLLLLNLILRRSNHYQEVQKARRLRQKSPRPLHLILLQ
jgi:hypothetical protein